MSHSIIDNRMRKPRTNDFLNTNRSGLEIKKKYNSASDRGRVSTARSAARERCGFPIQMGLH
jgi:hypothetical protein